MSDLTENQIQRAIAKYLDTVLPVDAFWTAINPMPGKSIVAAANSKAMGMKAGVPDILIVFRSDSIWIEVKKEGGYLSKTQKLVHSDIQDAGGRVYTCRSIEDMEEILIMEGIQYGANGQKLF